MGGATLFLVREEYRFFLAEAVLFPSFSFPKTERFQRLVANGTAFSRNLSEQLKFFEVRSLVLL